MEDEDEFLIDHGNDTELFDSLQNLNIGDLFGKDVTNILPYLTKLLLSKTFTRKQELLKLLYNYHQMNDVIEYTTAENIAMSDTMTLAPESTFEFCNHRTKLTLVAAEYINIHGRARQATLNANPNCKLLQSNLFDNPIYVQDVSYCLCTHLLNPKIKNSVMNIVDMSEALLHVKYGTAYIIRIIMNMPYCYDEICESLINHGDKQDEGPTFNEVAENRANTLRLIFNMNPSFAFDIRSQILHRKKIPSLAVMITVDNLKSALDTFNESRSAASQGDNSYAVSQLEECYDNAITFLTGILLGVDDEIRQWFSQYIKGTQKRIDQSHPTVFSKLRSQIVVYMNEIFPSLLDNYDLENGSSSDLKDIKPNILSKKLIRAMSTLRLYCALRGLGSIKLNQDESDIIMRLITSKLPLNQTSVYFATTGVCTLLVCPALINNSKEEKRAAEWLKWLIKKSNYGDIRYSSHGKCSISELLLLIATHFQNNQNNQIAELICATLGMNKLQIKSSISKCKSLFVQEVFNDQMVAEHAVKVPVTKNLNNGMVEFLPVHCIHQLLESRSFSKHQIPIKAWIYNQICESKKPIHNIMPRLIEAYVNSAIVSTSAHGHCGTNEPLDEAEILRVFSTQLYSKGDSKASIESEINIVDPEAAQVLMLYYLLLYEDIRLRKNSELSSSEKAKLVKYSPDFMMEIPIFYLLQLVRDNKTSFGVILPSLLKLVASQYPQLCSIQHWLNMENYDFYKNPKTSNDCKASTKIDFLQELKQGFSNLDSDCLTITKTIKSILALPRQEIWPFVHIFVENLPTVMEVRNSKLKQVTTKLWWKFNTIFPRKLWVMTVNVLKRPQNLRSSQYIRPVEYSWDELTVDPLLVLRCDGRVFRCSDTLNIILHILSAFLAASSRSLQDQINELPGNQKDTRNLEELKTTLILAQTSAAIQILLESCQPSQDEQEALSKRRSGVSLDDKQEWLLERFESSVDCICEHLHQVFIADTNLAKLVHFQTYPSDLLATTSNKIPSMHICLDFIPELLSQPDLSKQIFVIELASHLCEKYAITKSLNVAKLCFNVAYTLLQVLPSDRRALFFIPVLPALMRICKVFPILREDAELIMSQLEQVTLAHLASKSSRLSLGSSKPFDDLEKVDWRDIKKQLRHLDLHEALYLCIQKVTES